MRTFKIRPRIFILLFMLVMITACAKNKTNSETTFQTEQAKEDTKKVCGSWAYIHDKETEIAKFSKDGTARYDNKDYTFVCDGQYIQLTDTEGETLQLRYTFDGEKLYLYTNTTYTYDGDKEPDGLIGEWSCEEKNWSFAFTNEGTFMEDGYFPGHYTVDEENSTFKLCYNDHFEDTVCYFELIDKNQLRIEYPWRVVETETK